MVAVTVFVTVSITDTVLEPLLETQACDRSGETAAPSGKAPTGIVATTVFVVGSITDTLLPRRFATYRLRVAALAAWAVTRSNPTATTVAAIWRQPARISRRFVGRGGRTRFDM